MVNGICLFSELDGNWRVKINPPSISGTTKGMTMKFLPNVDIHKDARNKKLHNLSALYIKDPNLEKRFLKLQFLGILA